MTKPSNKPRQRLERPSKLKVDKLPILTVTDRVLLPHQIVTLRLNNAHHAPLMAQLRPHDRLIIAHAESIQPQSIAVEAQVMKLHRGSPDSYLLLRVLRRVQLTQINDDATAHTREVAELPIVKGKLRELVALYRQMVLLDENIPTSAAEMIIETDDASALTDMIAATLDLPAAQQITLLNTLEVDQRIALLLRELVNRLTTLEAHNELNTRVQSDMSNNQREAYLREQLRIIQGELGESDPFAAEIIQLRANIQAAGMPPGIEARALTELSRLQQMPYMSPEAGVIRTYIQWLIDVPWSKASRDNLNLRHAEKVLEQAHYGLPKVKERVLEHIAVRKLAGKKMRTPILCFVGPPGVGKTSLGKTIAKALGREFVRVSLGGVRDEAEIRGHRRTYVGALPGRIIETMKQAGTVNPVLLLDEIDKMSEDYRGDPAAALLEVLDPEQNTAFSDHYLEVPYDLSQVLFIATANDLDPLPAALEDRMEVIEFRPYTEEEKVEIARRFLIPKALNAHGLARRKITFQTDAIQLLIRQYTLEAGVRGLEREIANICRKLARLVAAKRPYPRRITPRLVEKYLGAPYIIESRVNREDSIGLVTGLVWSPSGGDTQIIEVTLLPGKGTLTLTGQLGDVLQESAQTALSFMRSKAIDLDVPVDDFENYDVHVHLPEGGVPKDGPSAGIALATGIISAFTEQKVRADYAMTGEITLRGYVLPVGGIKEKVLAARRRKIANIILPADNSKDLVDIPRSALRDVNITFVKHMDEVMEIMLHSAPEQRQRDLQAAEREADDES
ncbi:MAG: endopeptidase La [Aggregatilineales bacterium]